MKLFIGVFTCPPPLHHKAFHSCWRSVQEHIGYLIPSLIICIQGTCRRVVSAGHFKTTPWTTLIAAHKHRSRQLRSRRGKVSTPKSTSKQIFNKVNRDFHTEAVVIRSFISACLSLRLKMARNSLFLMGCNWNRTKIGDFSFVTYAPR